MTSTSPDEPAGAATVIVVEQMLASHSRIHGAGGHRLAARTFESITEVVGRDVGPLEALDLLDATGLKLLADCHLAGVRELLDREVSGPLPDRVVDKMPDDYGSLREGGQTRSRVDPGRPAEGLRKSSPKDLTVLAQ